jgi:cell filamentation protein
LTDPYSDPETGILRNLVSARTSDQLAEREDEAFFIRSATIGLHIPADDWSWTQLSGIHKHLFQDVYSWAGEIRTVGISKMSPSGMIRFLLPSFIEEDIARLFTKLDPNEFSGLSSHDFADKLAVAFAELNYIHPFREGNGRAQRELWSRLAVLAGHDLDWSRVSAEQNVHASSESAEGRMDPLRMMLRTVVMD